MKRFAYIDAIAYIKACEIPELARNSVINHHVQGMTYLCLKRTSSQTLKIYIMDKTMNVNDGFLVHPHNHRYVFDSTVLHGSLHHVRFKESATHGNHRIKYRYDWKSKSIKRIGLTKLYVSRDDLCVQGDDYRVLTNEFHTLKPLEKTIVGIAQHEDTCENSFLFLTQSNAFKKPSSRIPTPEEYLKKLRWVHETLIGVKL